MKGYVIAVQAGRSRPLSETTSTAGVGNGKAFVEYNSTCLLTPLRNNTS